MNKNVKLSNNEFLSIYTGVLFGENMSVVKNAFEKLYDYCGTPYTAKILHEIFKNYIDENRPDLSNAIKQLGDIKIYRWKNVDKQLNNYLSKFKNIIGSEYVVINEQSKDDEIEM